MCEWLDEDLFYDPTGAQEVINKAQSDIVALFTYEVKRTIEEAANAQTRLDDLNSQIRGAEYALNSLNRRVKEANERCEKAELYDVPARYIQKFVTKATGNYAPGDIVWWLRSKGNYEKCESCNGTGKIKALHNGREIDAPCPDCRGRGKCYASHFEVEKRTVQSIYLKLCFSKDRVSYWNSENLYLHGYDFDVSPDQLYPTEESALVALAAKQREEKNGNA